MTPDPSASMRCWALDLEIGGQIYTVPPLPAADWWPLLAGRDDYVEMIGMLPPGHDLEDRILAGEIGTGDLASVFLDGLEQICGRPVKQAAVIAAVAESGWAWVGGQLALAGFRWDVMPLAAVLDAVHMIALERLTEEDRARYEKLLADADPEATRAAALSDFENAAGPRPAGSSAAPSGDTPPRTRTPSRPPRPRAPRAEPTPPPGAPAHSAQQATPGLFLAGEAPAL